MTQDELHAVLARRSGVDQRVHAALRQHGPMSDPQLRRVLGSSGSGPRDALARLLPLGFVRYAGKATTPGRAMLYEATPAPEVEQAAERYEVRKPRKRRGTGGSAGPRLAELRQMTAGDFRQWHQVREKILGQTKLLYRLDNMAFWESAPPDELALVLEELVELQSWTEDTVAAIRERLQHEAVKVKVAKLNATSGRTPAEKETARRLAKKLSRNLIDGV